MNEPVKAGKIEREETSRVTELEDDCTHLDHHQDEPKHFKNTKSYDLPMNQITPGIEKTMLRKRGRNKWRGTEKSHQSGNFKEAGDHCSSSSSSSPVREKGSVSGDVFISSTNKETLSGAEEIDGFPSRAYSSAHTSDSRTQFVVTWLYQNYEASVNTSVPRSAVFNQYVQACTSLNMEPVNPATFGKVIRAVFADLKTRRLGTRGHSKYHYFGIAPFGTAAALAEGVSPTCLVTPGPKRKMRIPLGCEAVETNLCQQQQQQQQEQQQLQYSRQSNETGLRTRPINNHPMQPMKGEVLPYQPLIPDFEEFARFVEQICIPIPEKLPKVIHEEAMRTFSSLYQNHIVHLLRLISARDFQLVEMALGMFWNGLPRELWPCLACEEGIRIISIADDYLFQVAIHILVPDVLEPLPLPVAQAIRYFAKSLGVWMTHVFDANVPSNVINVKTDIAQRFCQVLRRRTSLNHLAQAVRAILASVEHVAGMLHDFSLLDFASIREQLHWVVPGQDTFVAYVEASFKNYLFEGASLPQWAQWLESMVEQCLAVDLAIPSSNTITNNNFTTTLALDEASRAVMLRWSFFTTMIMRDMTLRSANSFGSYHLLRLMFDEYVMHYLEKKLDEHRRALGLLSYWPAQQESAGPVMQPGYENAMAGFASMDDLFRKSGLLAYSQPSELIDQQPQLHHQQQQQPSLPVTPTTTTTKLFVLSNTTDSNHSYSQILMNVSPSQSQQDSLQMTRPSNAPSAGPTAAV